MSKGYARGSAAAFVLAALYSHSALAAQDDIKLFDRDGVPGLSMEEFQVYLLHKNNPTFAKYDTNYDGKISASEAVLMNKEAESFKENALPFYRSSFKQKYGALGVMPLNEAIDAAIPEETDGCGTQKGIYVRRDKADISIYSGKSIKKNAAKGASINFTHDAIANEDIANINGVATWVVARNPCRVGTDSRAPKDSFVSAYAIAPFVAANGALKSDGTGKNSLRFGIDAQTALFSGALFDNQYLTVSPFYQTDFQFKGSGYGVTATYEPYLLGAYLGGRIGKPKYLDFYWQTILEADVLHVTNAGATNLVDGSNYSWLGGTISAHFGILPEQLDDRLYADVAYKHFWDATNSNSVSLWSGEVGFNLTPEGDTSVSVEYQNGTAKESLERAETVTLNLNYKF